MKQEHLDVLNKFLEDCEGIAAGHDADGKPGDKFLLSHTPETGLEISQGYPQNPQDAVPFRMNPEYVDDIKREGRTLTITYHSPNQPDQKLERSFTAEAKKRQAEPEQVATSTGGQGSQMAEKEEVKQAQPVKGKTRK